MEFDEHDEREEQMGIPAQASYETQGNNSGRPKMTIASGGESASLTARKSGNRYRECLKNHAIGLGGHAVDGCGEFLAAGEEGTQAALKCAACNCHRNFHRKEIDGENFHHQQPSHHRHHHHHHHHNNAHAQFSQPHYLTPPPGFLHHRPLALPATSGGGGNEQDYMSNPSSSGGGGGGSGGGGGTRKRHRTKFTKEQKDKMLEFAERLGWRIQKHDEADVQLFCQETDIKRHVLKVWMHNNKHTLGKKP